MSSTNMESEMQEDKIIMPEDDSGNEEWAIERQKILGEQRIKEEKYEARKKALMEKLTKKRESPPVYPRAHPEIEGVTILSEVMLRRVELWPSDVIIKKGPGTSLEEVEALKLAQRMDLPAPRYLRHEKMNDESVSIHMTFIKGEPLEQVWPSRTKQQRREIILHIRDFICRMRSHPSETGLIGAAGNGVVRVHHSINTRRGDVPWMTQEQFRDFVVYLHDMAPPAIRNTLIQNLSSREYDVVFTHGDLTPRNIMVNPETNKLEGIVDWEMAGWYPAYWEYVQFFECVTSNRDWRAYAEDIFPQTYNSELIDRQAILRWTRP